MKTSRVVGALLTILAGLMLTQPLLGVPTFQAYIDDSMATTMWPDEQTWVTTDNPFSLTVVGAYQAVNGKVPEQRTTLQPLHCLFPSPKASMKLKPELSQ